MDRRAFLRGAATGAAAAVVGVGAVPRTGRAGPPPGDEPAATVEMTNQLTYDPETVTVGVGETVEWRNTSALVHTVTADESKESLEESADVPEGAEPFHSGRLEPGESFSHAFDTPGRYGYFCVPHEGAKMRGVVVVEQ